MKRWKGCVLLACVASLALLWISAQSQAEDARPEQPAPPDEAWEEEALVALERSCELSEQELIRLSEAYGHFLGEQLVGSELPLDRESMMRGARLALKGFPSPMGEEEFRGSLSQLKELVFAQTARTNLVAAEEFLASHATREDIESHLDGKLLIRIERAGTGAAVTDSDVPLVRFACHLADGRCVAASKGDAPVSLPLEQTIPGVRAGISGMREGEVRTLFIHPALAYGPADRSAPNSLLIVNVELIEVSHLMPTEDTPHALPHLPT